MEQRSYDESEITPIGITDWRNVRQQFGIKDQDRLRHLYVLGKSGVGKSTLLTNMAISDIEKAKNLAVLDVHGDVAETLLHHIPAERIHSVIYFNPADTEHPIAFNPLYNIPAAYHHLAASNLISTFKKLWDSWGPRLEHILRFTLLSLLEYQEATLLDIQPLLTNPFFREKVLSRVTSPHVIAFWRNEFEKYSPAFRAEAIAPILNKMGVFVASTPLRNTVGQRCQGIDIHRILNDGILIANLSKGTIGEDAASLLGSMLISSIQLAALARATEAERDRKPFYLYVDEAHNFLTLAFVGLLSEARKFGLSLFLAHQYIEQLHEDIRAAVFGNCGTLIVFRVGAVDAEYLAKEFYPVFTADDFVNLPRYSMYLKLMIDNVTSKPFSARNTVIKDCGKSNKDTIISILKKKYEHKQRKLLAPFNQFDNVSIEDVQQGVLFKGTE